MMPNYTSDPADRARLSHFTPSGIGGRERTENWLFWLLFATAAVSIGQVYAQDAAAARRIPLNIGDASSVESHRHALASITLAGLVVAVVLVLVAATLVAATYNRVASFHRVHGRDERGEGSTPGVWQVLCRSPLLSAAWATWAVGLCVLGASVVAAELQLGPHQGVFGFVSPVHHVMSSVVVGVNCVFTPAYKTVQTLRRLVSSRIVSTVSL